MCDAYFIWVVGQCLAVKPATVLGARVSVKPQTILDWEKGTNLPDPAKRFAIHKVMTQVLSPEAYEKFPQNFEAGSY